MGTKVKAGDAFKYEWLSVLQVQTIAKELAAGLVSMDLCPQVEGEGM